MESKDLFSGHARVYAAYRPVYPEALYTFLFEHVNTKNLAWDCATGNGQVARRLAKDFTFVHATDISPQQLREAFQAPNIRYDVQPAEHTSFEGHCFDLITVGQALHWFRQDEFFKEVRRTGKPGAVLAVWGYSHLEITPQIDRLVQHYYHHTVGTYWDEARRLVENQYTSIHFPFTALPSPSMHISATWHAGHLRGYLESWSATQGYIKARKKNPVHELMKNIEKVWPSAEALEVRFPLFLKVFKI